MFQEMPDLTAYFFFNIFTRIHVVYSASRRWEPYECLDLFFLYQIIYFPAQLAQVIGDFFSQRSSGQVIVTGVVRSAHPLPAFIFIEHEA